MHSAITPVILTRNEEPNIGRVLERLTTAAEVIVLDSMSTDRTAEIARTFANVRLVQRAFDDHQSQWTYGSALARTPWVLALDADYIVSDGLLEELDRDPDSAGHLGYVAAFRYCIDGVPLRASLYPPRVVLYRRDAASFVGDGHTQRLQLTGTPGRLASTIDHDDRKSLSSWLDAQRRYARLELDKLRASYGAGGRTDRLRRHGWIMPLLTPAYCLFVKRLLLDGRAGWIYTLQRTYFETLLGLMILSRHD